MKIRGISLVKKLLATALFAPLLAVASGPELHLDKAPVSTDPAALANGAKLFVNYCLNCHGASYMRYNRLGGNRSLVQVQFGAAGQRKQRCEQKRRQKFFHGFHSH